MIVSEQGEALDDLTLARKLAANNPDAIDALLAQHHTAVYRFLRQLTRRTEDAEDLAQQTLLRAIKGAERFHGRASMRAWLLGIAFREFTKWRRRKPWMPLLADRPASRDLIADIVQARALLDALKKLPADHQATFLLHYVEELSTLEVAAALGIPEGTVKSRLHSARQRMRSLLEDKETPYVPEPCKP